MKTFFSAVLVAVFLFNLSPLPVEAGTLSRACMTSDRKAKSRSLCRCLQDVADRNLSNRDQKLAASFFKDPHKAQEIRQSDKRSHEQFWKRYKEFGVTFSKTCGHLK